MRPRPGKPLLPLLLISAACLLGGANSAAAAQLSCGDVVTHDVRLDNDLLDCAGDGLVIGADGVSLSLGGHVVDGLGASSPFGSSGIDNSGGFDDVRIFNGTVREFRTGVELVGTHGNVVRGLSVHDNQDSGIFVDGFASLDSFENRVVANNVSDARFGAGIQLRGSMRNAIRRNHLSGNGGDGLAVTFSSRSNSVTGNSIADNHANGIQLIESSGDNEVKRNGVAGNALSGIAVFGSSANQIVANDLEANAGAGVSVASGFREPPADDNLLRLNSSLGNGSDGIFVGGPSEFNGIESPGPLRTRVVRNEASGNDDDGIDVRSPSAALGYNTANVNAHFGIFAVPGVTDLGGNRATGNRTADCVNVSC